MDYIDTIATALDNENVGTLTVGDQWTIYKKQFQKDPDDAILIYEKGGGAPDLVSGGIAFRNPTAGIIVRSKDPSAVAAKIEEIIPVILALPGSGEIVFVTLAGDVGQIGLDINSRHHDFIDFQLKISEAA